MNLKQIVKVTDVTKKLSGQNNVYFEIDFLEDTAVDDGKGSTIKRQWNKIYYAKPEKSVYPLDLVGTVCEVDLNIYSLARKVGDKVYTDIKMNALDLKPFVVE